MKVTYNATPTKPAGQFWAPPNLPLDVGMQLQVNRPASGLVPASIDVYQIAAILTVVVEEVAAGEYNATSIAINVTD